MHARLAGARQAWALEPLALHFGHDSCAALSLVGEFSGLVRIMANASYVSTRKGKPLTLSSTARQQRPQRGPALTKRLGVCAVGCAVTALAACSGSSPTSSSVSGSTASSSSQATPTPAATPATLSQLKKIVLQTADLPKGWKGTPYKPDSSDSTDNAALAKCVGARDTTADQVADAHSDDFALGSATISSDASSFRSQSDLVADKATLRSPKLSSCIDNLLKKQIAASLPAGATVEPSFQVRTGPSGGPSNVVAMGTSTINIDAGGTQLKAYVTIAFITGPLVEAELDAEDLGAPVPASVMNPLIATVAARANKG